MYCYDTVHNLPYKNKQVNTFIPVRQVKAANTGAGKDVNLTLYDYRLLYSMTEPYRAIASQYGIPDTESNRRSYTPMYAAELSYLKFALPYNMPVRLEVYADGERLGSLAGLRYMGHVTGSQGMYTIKTGYNEPVVREDMKKRYEQRCEETNSLTGMFLPMEIVPGIGLTGEPLAYRTLMGYYDYYYLAYPFGDSVSGNNADNAEDTDTETEGISVSGNDRETEEATEELNKESSSGTEETVEKESTEESSFATEEAGAAEESGPAEESRTAENESAGTEESAETERISGTEERSETESISDKRTRTAEESAEVPEREAGFEPYALSVKNREPDVKESSTDIAEETESSSEETEAEESSEAEKETKPENSAEKETERETETETETELPSFSKEELAELFYLNEEEAAFLTEEDWEILRRSAAGEEPLEGVPEEEIPEDFYIASQTFPLQVKSPLPLPEPICPTAARTT